MYRKVSSVLEPLKLLQSQPNKWVNVLSIVFEHRCSISTSRAVPSQIEHEPASTNQPTTKTTISKAMRSYLERARQHDEFMKKEQHEFAIGKRHLANMMGEDPDTFTQDDVNNAIEYLFPSGLYEKRARPHMLPPEEVFPQSKEAEFDETGRPFHFMFYTARPNFYQVLYDIVENMEDLYRFEDVMNRKGLEPDPNLKLDLSGYNWIDKTSLEQKIMETLNDRDYNSFVNAIERLASLPYSYKFKDFILKYMKPLMGQTETYDAPKPQYDTDGRAFVTTYECLRKTARGDVTLRSPGTGKITINGEDITYFKDLQSREQLLFPLLFTDMHTKLDVEAHVEGGGSSGQAGAIRWGIAWGLRSFVDQETIEKMRIAGLLTRDYRTRERKKPGQKGARKKFTWKKR